MPSVDCYSPTVSWPERQHVEAVVELRAGASAAEVTDWLERRGLAVMPVVAGLLASGDADVFARAFGTPPSEALPVPRELEDAVEAVVVVPPKYPHVEE
jgi:hypothetical protein